MCDKLSFGVNNVQNQEGRTRMTTQSHDHGIAMLVADIQGGRPVIVDVNDAELRNNGFTREELIGKDPSDCFDTPATNRDAIIRAVEEVEQGRPSHFVAKVKKKDGTPYAIRALVSGNYDEAGKLQRIYFAATLIPYDDPACEVINNACVMARAEQLAGTGAWRYSRRFRELVVSDNLYAILGLECCSLDLEGQLAELLPEATMTELHERTLKCLLQGKPFTVKYHFVDMQGMERMGAIKAEPEHDANGKVIAVNGVVQDESSKIDLVTENELIMAASHMGAAQLDEVRGILHLSPESAAILGMDKQPVQIARKEWAARIHPRDFEHATESHLACTPEQPYSGACYRVLHESGAWRWLGLRFMTRFDRQRERNRTYITISDVHERKEAEERLRISEQRFRDVLSQSREIIYELDTKGNFTYISELGPELLGYSQEEFLNLSLNDILDKQGAGARWQRERLTHDQWQNEVLIRCKDGSLLYMEVNSCPIVNDEGETTGFRGAARDITEQVRAQHELAEGKARLLEVIETAKGVVFETDANGYLTYLSHTTESLFGYTPDELIGKPTYVLSPDIPPDHDAWVREIHALGSFTSAEQRFCKKDDPTDHWLRVTSKALRDDDGSITGFRGMVFDITAHKLAERHLETSRKRLQEVVQAAGGCIFELNAEGRFTHISGKSEILGNPVTEELIGEYTWTLGRHLKPRHPEWLQAIQSRPEGMAVEMQLGDVRQPGANWVQTHCVARRDESGKVFGYRGVAFDITHKKHMQEALLQAKEDAESAAEERARFLSTMSHEIRTPLNAVIGMTDLLLMEAQTAEQEKLTRVANLSGRHLLALINDILDYSKLDAGKVELEQTAFNLRQTCADIRDILADRAMEKGLEMNWYAADDLADTYLGDPARIRQILLNLVGNAIKFTDAGHVNISAAPKGSDTIRFTVEDTGIGIAEDARGKLFKDFQQADASTTRKFGGTGLGLAICKQIVDLIGGTIGVESEEGKGSTFWFELPMQADQSHTESETRPAKTGNAMPHCRILVAEDNPANQLLIRTLLEKLGQDVTLVENGEEAVQAVGAASFDFVFMDMQMPVLDGMSATRVIRANGHDLPIIALTANVPDDSNGCHIKAGIDDWLCKPFNPADIVQRIVQWGGRTPRTQTPDDDRLAG